MAVSIPISDSSINDCILIVEETKLCSSLIIIVHHSILCMSLCLPFFACVGCWVRCPKWTCDETMRIKKSHTVIVRNAIRYQLNLINNQRRKIGRFSGMFIFVSSQIFEYRSGQFSKKIDLWGCSYSSLIEHFGEFLN